MALYDTVTPSNPYQSVTAGVIPLDVYGVAINWYVNRTPLLSRLPKLDCGSDTFLMTNDNFRPTTQNISANYTTGSSTQLTFADASWLMLGDVVQVESEYFLVTTPHATTPTVTGAYAGTTGANHTSGVAAYLIGNTRTGAEVDIAAIERIPVTVEQYNQTAQHAIAVGGSLQANTNFVSGEGNTPLDRDRMLAILNIVDDFERSMYFGKGVKRASTSTRPMMKGLTSLITTNVTTSPTNASAYKQSDFIRDTIQPCYTNGGQPGMLLVSTDFLTAFSIWGNGVLKAESEENIFGLSVDTFAVSFLPNVKIVPAPHLRTKSAFCFTESEIRIRMKRKLKEYPRGLRGDAIESDLIMEGAIELDNEAHHSYVTGITTFA